MFSPLLKGTLFAYTRLLAATWHTNLSAPTVCTSTTGQKLIEWSASTEPELPLVLNCNGVTTIEDHALSELGKHLAASHRVIAFLVDDRSVGLVREIESELRAVKVCSESIDGTQVLIYGERPPSKTLRDHLDTLAADGAILEREFAKKTVAASYKPFRHPERLDSTPLIASGVLNARALISDPEKFCWLAILLTDLFQSVIEQARPRTNRVLAVSLRGSPFAAAVRLLAHNYSPSLEIIDHIGPKHEVLEALIGQDQMYGAEYVMVGDFVIGGTELKVARAYAMSQGAVMNNAIAIGSYLSGEAYGRQIRLQSLVNVADAVPELKYEFCAD